MAQAHADPSRPPGYARLLRENPNLRRLWYGQVVSQMGDYFSTVAVMALLIERSGERAGTGVALYTVIRHLPLFLLGPAAGIAADRLDRRRILIVTDLLRGVLALAYLVTWAGGPLWVLYAATAGLAGISLFFNTARGALLPTITTRNQLMVANALSAATYGTTLAVGSLIGGVIAGVLGRGTAFVLNALSFLLSAVIIAKIQAPARQREASAGAIAVLGAMHRDIVEGFVAVRRHPALRGLLFLPAAWALGTGAARILYSLYGASLGLETMGELVRNPRDFGIAILYAAMGTGAVAGTFLARRMATRPAEDLVRAIPRALFVDGLGLAALSIVPNLAGAFIVLLIREVGYALWWTSHQTAVMLLAPDTMRGRVFAAQESLMTLALLLSMLTAGPAVDQGGLRAVALAAGGIIIAASILFALWSRTLPRKEPGHFSR
ncbi:MAG TPA: MFS transporter [Armatimonadota bacterium]|nr:MFS transporter [Armatimonadota bacterium]HOM80663.1 MFS transporter [Armatimonadota bacterium]HOQ27585.1 MFS transporter [Armatimonadota bacterium]HPO72181.1 MFS transporter [Armatimonadota bacterium]HPT97339.1 MFS transporter [Armatimonadota bacterium]